MIRTSILVTVNFCRKVVTTISGNKSPNIPENTYGRNSMRKNIFGFVMFLIAGVVCISCITINASDTQIQDLAAAGYPIIFDGPIGRDGDTLWSVKYKNISSETISNIVFFLRRPGGSENGHSIDRTLSPNQSGRTSWGTIGGEHNGSITRIIVTYEDGRTKDLSAPNMLANANYSSSAISNLQIVEQKEQPKDDPAVIEPPDFDIVVSARKVAIKKYKGNASEVVIPEKIGGLDVSVIQTGAFSDNHIIETITIPRYIERVQANAFESCTNLKKVILMDARELTTGRNQVFDKNSFSNMGMIVIKAHEVSSTISSEPSTLDEGSTQEPTKTYGVLKTKLDTLNENSIQWSYYDTNIKPENGFYSTKFNGTYVYFTYKGKEYGPCGIDNIQVSLRDGKIFYMGLGFEKSVFIGYNDKTYLAAGDGFDTTDIARHKIEQNGDFIYLKRLFDSNNMPYAQLYINDTPISSVYDKIEIINYESPDDIWYIGKKNDTYFACRNDIIIAQKEDEFYDIQLVNNSIYYANEYFADSILKDNGEIVTSNENGIFSFTVSNDEANIAYVSHDGITTLFLNNQLIDSTRHVFVRLHFSPDGSRLYYLEARDMYGAFRFYIKGQGIPPIISGPYYEVEDPVFSDNSKYVAYIVASDVPKIEGAYVITNFGSNIYGPYNYVQIDFTGTSMFQISHKKNANDAWLVETVNLR